MKKLTLFLVISLGFGVTGCATPGEGALAGGALGAGLGAVVGGASGHAGEGALIGGAAGAITGAVISDQNQRSYSRSYHRKSNVAPARSGYYETRVRRGPSGELYEERVWVRR